MNIFSLVFRGKFNAGKDLDAFFFSGFHCFRKSFHRIVIGQGKCRKAGLFGK